LGIAFLSQLISKDINIGLLKYTHKKSLFEVAPG